MCGACFIWSNVYFMGCLAGSAAATHKNWDDPQATASSNGLHVGTDVMHCALLCNLVDLHVLRCMYCTHHGHTCMFHISCIHNFMPSAVRCSCATALLVPPSPCRCSRDLPSPYMWTSAGPTLVLWPPLPLALGVCCYVHKPVMCLYVTGLQAAHIPACALWYVLTHRATPKHVPAHAVVC